MSRTTGLKDTLLGTEPTLRVRTTQSALALLLTASGVVGMQYICWVLDLDRWGAVLAWSLTSLGSSLLAFIAIRSGWSLRLKDPSLTGPQIVFAVACAAWGYALAAQMRAMALPLLMIVLVFSMFQLRARATMWLSLFALAAFAFSMALMAISRPAVFPPLVELGHFMILAFSLPAVSVLAARLSHIRRRLSEQKTDLAQALQLIQAMATRDDLTGLLNRRHMQTLLEQETQRCLRNGHGYCLALLDLDHFKRINDSLGHGAGDAALRAFAHTAQEAVRGADVLARWGGEEFVLMLPDTRMPAAFAAVERVRANVEAMSVPMPDSISAQPLKITVSAGLTEHRMGDSLMQTLERADKLLYRAKSEGRNRVTGE